MRLLRTPGGHLVQPSVRVQLAQVARDRDQLQMESLQPLWTTCSRVQPTLKFLRAREAKVRLQKVNFRLLFFFLLIASEEQLCKIKSPNSQEKSSRAVTMLI